MVDGDKGRLIDDVVFGGEDLADEFMNRGMLSKTELSEYLSEWPKGLIVTYSEVHEAYIEPEMEMDFPSRLVEPI